MTNSEIIIGKKVNMTTYQFETMDTLTVIQRQTFHSTESDDRSKKNIIDTNEVIYITYLSYYPC